MMEHTVALLCHSLWICCIFTLLVGTDACIISIGETVPFWFALKPPHGFALQILTWNSSHLEQSSGSLLRDDNPVFMTVYQGTDDGVLGTRQLISVCSTPTVHHHPNLTRPWHAVYNDEDPATGKEGFYRAHSKGVLRVKKDTAVWLQHRSGQSKSIIRI